MNQNDVVFITGATSGFGLAIAEHFATVGQPLVLLGRRASRLSELSEQLKTLTKVHTICCDIRDKEKIKHKIDHLPKDFSQIAVLVNNAGLALGLEPAYEASLEDWETMIDTNIKGLVYCTRFILPKMVETGKGHIINLGSVAGDWPYPSGNVYGATKAFVHMFSQNLRSDCADKNIKITNIAPGLAETEFSVVRFKGDEDKAASVYQGMTPLSGEDIAEIVSWVVSTPAHVNINQVEVMPVAQAWGGWQVARES